MIVRLLTEHQLEFLSLRGGCRGLSDSTHFKMPHCWKSHNLEAIRSLLCVDIEGESDQAITSPVQGSHQ